MKTYWNGSQMCMELFRMYITKDECKKVNVHDEEIFLETFLYLLNLWLNVVSKGVSRQYSG